MLVNATTLDDIRIEAVGENRAHTFNGRTLLTLAELCPKLMAVCLALDEELEGTVIPKRVRVVVTEMRRLLGTED